MTREELLRFVDEFWQAVTAGSSSETEQNVAHVFQMIRRDAAIIDADELPARVNDRREPTAFFCPSRGALWFNRAALKRWARRTTLNASTSSAEDGDERSRIDTSWFYDTRATITRPLNAFLERREHEKWWHTRHGHYGDIRRGSILLVGVDNAIIWIGSRTPDQVRVTMEQHPDLFRPGSDRFTNIGALLRELSDEQRAALLQQPIIDVRDVLLSGTKLVHEAAQDLARSIGIVFGQSELTITNGGLRSHAGTEAGIDYLVLSHMVERLNERDIKPHERILTILPKHHDPVQKYYPIGTVREGPDANTEERRAMLLDHCRMVLTIDGGDGSRAITAFAFSRKPRRIPVLPVVATPGIESAALAYWSRHKQLVKDDFRLADDDVRALSVARRRDDRALAARIVRILREKAVK